MRTSPRFLFRGFLVGTLLATQTGVVAAQIPNPLDTGGGQLPDPVATVDAALQEAVDAVTETLDTAADTVTTAKDEVKDTVKETVKDTTGPATGPTQTVKNTANAGTARDATGGSTTTAPNPLNVITGAASAQNEATGGTAGTSPPGAAPGPGPGTGSERGYTTAATTGGHAGIRTGGAYNSAALLAGSQPSLAILVDALNDADGDGIFSDAESAPAPAADVSFKALITNIGTTTFEIDGVSHTYAGPSGPAQGDVCGELAGLMLAPGESLACSFPVTAFAPARGERLVNTVRAAAFEVGEGSRRGASDSDNTTVDTAVAADEVLAVAIKRNLAFTGTPAARLVALALVLLASGGGFLSLARARARRPARQLPLESWTESLGWWDRGATKPRSNGRSRSSISQRR
jgi:hypothetical protein